MIVEGGTGNGYKAKVTSANMLTTRAVTISDEHYVNHAKGNAFSLLFDATPTGAGDCFLYLKNDSENDMVIEGIGIYAAADEYFDVKIGDTGTPAGGAAIIPVNANAGSGNLADGTFQDGNDITGLSGGKTLYRIYHASSAEIQDFNFELDVIIPKNSTFTIYCQTGTTALAGHINFYYAEEC